MRFVLFTFLVCKAVIDATRPKTCYSEQNQASCVEECRTPDSGATCDSEVVGNSLYWCCHNPSPGCYSNVNDAYAHCDTHTVLKIDDFNYCCLQSTCCHHEDKDCDPASTCCLDDCTDPKTCSYTEKGCGGEYGQLHNCVWDDKHSQCMVGLDLDGGSLTNSTTTML